MAVPRGACGGEFGSGLEVSRKVSRIAGDAVIGSAGGVLDEGTAIEVEKVIEVDRCLYACRGGQGFPAAGDGNIAGRGQGPGDGGGFLEDFGPPGRLEPGDPLADDGGIGGALLPFEVGTEVGDGLGVIVARGEDQAEQVFHPGEQVFGIQPGGLAGRHLGAFIVLQVVARQRVVEVGLRVKVAGIGLNEGGRGFEGGGPVLLLDVEAGKQDARAEGGAITLDRLPVGFAGRAGLVR